MKKQEKKKALTDKELIEKYEAGAINLKKSLKKAVNTPNKQDKKKK